MGGMSAVRRTFPDAECSPRAEVSWAIWRWSVNDFTSASPPGAEVTISEYSGSFLSRSQQTSVDPLQIPPDVTNAAELPRQRSH